MLDRLLEWDRDTFVYLNGLGIEKYDFFWSTVTRFDTWIPLFLLFIYLVFRAYPKGESYKVVGTILLAVTTVAILTGITKELVARVRPGFSEDIHTAIRILRDPSGYSFFSGHASSSFAITTSVFLFLRKHYKWCWVFFIWPLLFASSRIFVGVHFPLDILVGATVGIVFAVLFYRLYRRRRSI